METVKGKARGKKAAAAMTPEKRKAKAMKAMAAKKEKPLMRKLMTHSGILNLGGIQIPCFVTETGERVLLARGLQDALRLIDEDVPGEKEIGTSLGPLLESKSLRSLIYKESRRYLKRYKVDSVESLYVPLKISHGKTVIDGYRAEILSDICGAMLEAREVGLLDTERKQIIARQCDVLLDWLARSSIVARVDAVTGCLGDRARGPHAQELEPYVAKELRPYLKTFDFEFYHRTSMFRHFIHPLQPVNNDHPQHSRLYFGKLINDVVYRRLAPDILEALKNEARSSELSRPGFGRVELLKHMSMVIGLMRISRDWKEFMGYLNKACPRINDTIPPDLEEGDWNVEMANDIRMGDRVRLLGLPYWLIHDLPEDEQEEMRSFIGKSAVVDEVDHYGYYWLEFGSMVEEGDWAHCSGHSFCITREFIEPTDALPEACWNSQSPTG